MLACPGCRRPLDPDRACACGFEPKRRDGVLDLMTPEQTAAYAAFCDGYETLRRREGWGGDDLELPFEPRAHHDVWAVRQWTFKRLERLLGQRLPEGGAALDAGAGNCWLTRHLDHWGFEAVAVDVNDGGWDGLRAGGAYIGVGDHFERVRAPMERLPFQDGVFRLVIAADALHYCPDMAAALGEFKRVLAEDGLIVVMDSPWYERERYGVRAWESAVRARVDRHGAAGEVARRPRFLHREAFAADADRNGLRFELIRAWPGWRRALETASARFYERRLAAFPIAVLRDAA